MAEMQLAGVRPEWTLGDRLRKAREHAALNQTQMADELEIARNSVGRYESGAYEPPRTVVIAWALRTGVDLDWLAGDMVRRRRSLSQRSHYASEPAGPGVGTGTAGMSDAEAILELRRAIPSPRWAATS